MPSSENTRKEELHHEQESHEVLACPGERGLPAVLANLQGNRLGAVNHRMVHSRRVVSLYNDQAKSRMHTIVQSINKQIHDMDVKHKSESLDLKFKLVDMRGYRKCLKNQHQRLLKDDSSACRYGLYGGVTYTKLRPLVKEAIADNHPRQRRLRQAAWCLQNGLQDGHLIDGDAATRRLCDIVSKPFERFVWSRGTNNTMKAPFYRAGRRFSLHRQNEEYFKLTAFQRLPLDEKDIEDINLGQNNATGL